MKTITTSIITAMLSAGTMLAESGPTITEEYPLIERVNATTCKLSSRFACRGTECPTCTIHTGGWRDVMLLNFPDNALTCIEGKVRVPDNIDPIQEMTVRFTTTRIFGIPGNTDGFGNCTGGCSELHFLATPVGEDEWLGNYPWQIDPATGYVRFYRSDLIPGGGLSGSGRSVTAAVPHIIPADLELQRLQNAGIRVCRDARSFNQRDTQPATLAIESMYFVWRIDPFAQEAAKKAIVRR